MRRSVLPALLLCLLLASCWTNNRGEPFYPDVRPKVWGFKPVYGADTTAKKIFYSPVPQPVRNAGNIYAYRKYIFQMEPGTGIHVIDNTIFTTSRRIGFITVKGCSQISIKADKLYTNSYDDLVVIDATDLGNIREFSRLKGVFADLRYQSPISQPPSSGFFECLRSDSLIVAWKQDSVAQICFKH